MVYYIYHSLPRAERKQMTMAKLYFKYGAMGSSKTANALMARFNYEERGQQTLLVKPRMDTRDGDHMVYSRIGLKHPCVYFHEMQAMPDEPEIVGVNRSAERRAAVEKEFGIRTFATLAEAVSAAKPQAAFLCTAPASYGPTVMECIEAGLDVFMEINLIGDWYEVAAAMAKEGF